MAKEYSRTQRVGDFIKRELSGLIQFEIRDPRVGMVSVTDVEVSRDMSHAKVFVTVLGKETEQEAEESVEALNKAAGFLRSQIAKANNARTTPKLRFYFDSSVVQGQYLSNLIDKAVSEDKQHEGYDKADDDSEA
ncbi:30S ribosome-binding factor RbfA [Dasania sp. GY-MA-18]|uniref:Ribosome-binding factor A n=1 Tax=Dasania phycosphaerae TaxID=2950436 RepID=A0A9J6RG89_9GAMM|nr:MULTISPECIES: 30S ribosome-binding factor RbfA [Dasania]MCR8921234.1 30S ribosome-binding factor RbfA [Dasania sp. GY-MA-18]MCZ0863662.1 30S ribosome-binding factor RbfA [Dasania phycosphaerae]MCZ0867390.1 30S ribosome-binding factor RbfA [Dasania phycosphaerae]